MYKRHQQSSQKVLTELSQKIMVFDHYKTPLVTKHAYQSHTSTVSVIILLYTMHITYKKML